VSKRSSPKPKPEPAQPEARGKEPDSYEAIFTALAHPARRHILMTLNFEGGEMTAGDIAAMFEHAWPTTTRHLRVLEAAKLIAHERRGRTRVYRMERRQLALAHQWLAWFFKKPG
jgi:DNA-binding transcriptional ArsR family regulator